MSDEGAQNESKGENVYGGDPDPIPKHPLLESFILDPPRNQRDTKTDQNGNQRKVLSFKPDGKEKSKTAKR